MCENPKNPTAPHDPNSRNEPPSVPVNPSDPSSSSDAPTPSPSRPPGSDDSSSPTANSSSSPSAPTAALPSTPSPRRIAHGIPSLIQIDLIVPSDPRNGRLDLDPIALQDLADDIAQHGLLNPVTVRRDGQIYDVIAGNRRLAAMRRLGWTDIPCTLKDCTPRAAAIMRLHENTKRTDLTPVEEAAQIQGYITDFDPTQEELLDAFDCKPAWLEGRLELLDYTPELQQFLHAGTISLGAARLLARIPDPATRDMYTRHAAAHGVSISTARLWLQESQSQPATENELPNLTVKNAPEIPISIVLVSCFVCARRIELQQSISTHLCTLCSETLAQAQRETNADAQLPEDRQIENNPIPLQ